MTDITMRYSEQLRLLGNIDAYMENRSLYNEDNVYAIYRHQKAEIERLKASNEMLNIIYDQLLTDNAALREELAILQAAKHVLEQNYDAAVKGAKRLEGELEQVKALLVIINQVLEIAEDWNAPTSYDIELPESYSHLKEPACSDPDWLCVYRLRDHIRDLTTQARPEQEA